MDIFRITQSIEVIEEDKETGKKELYFSRIEDMSEESLFITPPFRKGFYLPPRRGRKIVVRLPADICSYLFEAVLLAYHSSASSLPLWEISLPDTIRRVQMREFVRLDIAIELKIELTDAAGSERSIVTRSKNISAGGVHVLLPELLPVKTKLTMTFSLLPEEEFQAEGEIIRIIPPEQDGDKSSAGIKFSKIDEKTRQQIVKFIFQEQVKRRKKEKEIFE
jgi:c-di-GMP-binding flagellar brake protein YcgR